MKSNPVHGATVPVASTPASYISRAWDLLKKKETWVWLWDDCLFRKPRWYREFHDLLERDKSYTDELRRRMDVEAQAQAIAMRPPMHERFPHEKESGK